MLNYPVSDSLKDLLGRQNARATTAGTDEASRMMKWANALIDREEMIEAGHPPAGEGARPMGLRLVFSNTQSVRRGGRKLCLVLIEGGKR